VSYNAKFIFFPLFSFVRKKNPSQGLGFFYFEVVEKQ
jgi:hypothetical protein